jgi:hypothetical protein
MPTCQPRYETRGCKWNAVLPHSVLLVRITSKHVDFNNLPSALLYRGVTTGTFSFSSHFCKFNLQKLFNSLNKLQLRVAVTSSSLLVTLQLDSKRYSLHGSYRPHLQHTRANALLDNAGVGVGGKENKRTNGQKTALQSFVLWHLFLPMNKLSRHDHSASYTGLYLQFTG